jgi:hypothetical protein
LRFVPLQGFAGGRRSVISGIFEGEDRVCADGADLFGGHASVHAAVDECGCVFAERARWSC